ncbi:MAG: hypothetical protein JRD03_05605, partial [Deltaproteobacteria bacterium]|nr:hypothetical protein [Deltaproteobacteria bacterium]
NTLIVEGKKGRAFEVTAEREMVWDYLNPHRLHDDRIARIWDLQRLDSDFPMNWLEPAADSIESLRIGAENKAEVPTSRNTAAAE